MFHRLYSSIFLILYFTVNIFAYKKFSVIKLETNHKFQNLSVVKTDFCEFGFQI